LSKFFNTDRWPSHTWIDFFSTIVLISGVVMIHRFLSLLLLFTLCTASVATGVEPATPQARDDEKQYGSVEERRLLLALQQERLNLVKEREAMENRKKDLKRLEAEVDKKLDRLQSTRLQIEQLLEQKNAEELKRLNDLSKMYAKMSSEKAARIFSTLDLELAIAILGRMKTKAAAKILNNMDRDRAAQLTTAFSTLK
jgi:flagellar motility protein MotE (MotC chaperone)